MRVRTTTLHLGLFVMMGQVFGCGDSGSPTSTDAAGTTGSTETTESEDESTGGASINTSTSSADETSDTGSSGATTEPHDTTGTTGEPMTTSDGSGTSDTGVGSCGDGIKDEGEECDGADLGEFTSCQALDIEHEIGPGGQITCSPSCELDTSGCDICYAPYKNEPCDNNSNDRMHALELNCALLNGEDFNELNSTSLVNGSLSFHAPDSDSWRVIRQFGTAIDPDTNKPYWSARGGEKFIALSTGNLDVPVGGVLEMASGAAQSGQNGENDNPDNLVELPGVMNHQHGGFDEQDPEVLSPFDKCEPGLDCSNTLEEHWLTGTGKGHEVLYFEFQVPVPMGTHSFELDFAFFSAEYPEWNGDDFLPFSDIAIIWAQSEEYTGNISFIDDGQGNKQPLVTLYLNERGLIAFNEDHEALEGTGFDGVGGTTGWLKARGNAMPGETLTLALSVIDRGDKLIDTVLLLDNFQWGCSACPQGTVDIDGSCGITLQ